MGMDSGLFPERIGAAQFLKGMTETVKLQFLGTAAAEGWPALFCDCPYCREARRLGGKNIRTRSQSIVDDRLLIDFPADTYWHSVRYGVHLEKIEHVLVTHSHEDHFYPLEFLNKRPGFARGYASGDVPQLHLYGNEAVFVRMNDALQSVFGEGGQKQWEPFLKLHLLRPFGAFSIGGYRITPLPCNHMATEQALIYLIEAGGKRLLYAHDTGKFLPETLEFLKGKALSAASLDCTLGALSAPEGGHMGFPENLALRRWMLENGCADENTVFVSNHFSHNGTAVYDKMVEIAKGTGFTISYDGMTITF